MLYIVATPIGNLDEITFRAVEVLKSVDLIAAEDTRRTKILLDRYGIVKPIISYRQHNEKQCAQRLTDDLRSGKNIALVSDAGMPAISDPGNILINELIESGVQYTVISGACACINALVLSGFDSRSFLMAGFLPVKNIDRQRYIEKFKDLQATLIFYSAPHDVLTDLEFLFNTLGARKVAVIREISKVYETVAFGTLGTPIDGLIIKGEFVIVVEGAQDAACSLNSLSVSRHVQYYIDTGLSRNEAVKKTAGDRGVAKSIIYSQDIKERNCGDGDAG